MKTHEVLADVVVEQLDSVLRTLFNVGRLQRPYPAAHVLDHNISRTACFTNDHLGDLTNGHTRAKPLSAAQQRHSAGLMRVNHVGEVCAQALYAGQSLGATSPSVKAFNQHAAVQERDHLLWTAQRLRELNAKPSMLNPLWYAGAWTMGCVAGYLGDAVSLAFVQETEAQVEAHLHSHAKLLPAEDIASKAIVAQMQSDEALHGAQAIELGAKPLPEWVRLAMRLSAKCMTQTAYYV